MSHARAQFETQYDGAADVLEIHLPKRGMSLSQTPPSDSLLLIIDEDGIVTGARILNASTLDSPWCDPAQFPPEINRVVLSWLKSTAASQESVQAAEAVES